MMRDVRAHHTKYFVFVIAFVFKKNNITCHDLILSLYFCQHFGFFFCVFHRLFFSIEISGCVRQSKCGPCSFLLTQEAKIEVTLSSWIWHTYKYQVCIIFIVMMPMPGHYITYNKFSFHHPCSLSLSLPSINLFDIVIVIIIITHRTIVFRFHAPIDLHTFRSISAFWDSTILNIFLYCYSWKWILSTHKFSLKWYYNITYVLPKNAFKFITCANW